MDFSLLEALPSRHHAQRSLSNPPGIKYTRPAAFPPCVAEKSRGAVSSDDLVRSQTRWTRLPRLRAKANASARCAVVARSAPCCVRIRYLSSQCSTTKRSFMSFPPMFLEYPRPSTKQLRQMPEIFSTVEPSAPTGSKGSTAREFSFGDHQTRRDHSPLRVCQTPLGAFVVTRHVFAVVQRPHVALLRPVPSPCGRPAKDRRPTSH